MNFLIFNILNPNDLIVLLEISTGNITNVTPQYLVDNDARFSWVENAAGLNSLRVDVDTNVTIGTTMAMKQYGSNIEFDVVGGQTAGVPPWIVHK